MTHQNHRADPSPVITVKDAYYIIFRHKWKILAVSLGGIALGYLFLHFAPVDYVSQAKLFVKYVVDATTPAPAPGARSESQTRTPDERGDTIMNTEIEILTSLDLAEQVAKAIGPAKILGAKGDTNNLALAAQVVNAGLRVEAPRRSSVIRIAFQHRDSTLVQPLLAELIHAYLKRHLEIHRDLGEFDEFLTRQTDQLRTRLSETESQLRNAKAKAGVISVDESRRISGEQVARIQQEMLEAESELAQRQAATEELSRVLHNLPVPSTNLAAVGVKTNLPVLTATTEQYKKVCSLLEALSRKEQELLLQFTPESSLVKVVRDQIQTHQRTKEQLETDNPGLLTTTIAESRPMGADGGGLSPRAELAAETSRIAGLQSKVRLLSERLAGLLNQASNVNGADATITELQRKKDLEEAHYKYFAEKLEQSRIDQALGANRVSNIGSIQAPSPAARNMAKLQKLVFLFMFACVGGAFALPVVIELYLDRSLRRPKDIETHLNMPLFMSIPLLKLNGAAKVLSQGTPVNLLAEKTGESASGDIADEAASVSSKSNGVLVPEPVSDVWDSKRELRPYCDGLRDQLITSFEQRDLSKKPKLVAVTSCATGSGVSSIAAGLASSLSETGDGNVLLVDLNVHNGAAHHFYNGELIHGIETALEADKRESTLVRENLYVVSERGSSGKLPNVLPHRLKHLVPRLKASDFDYIIFDMPPVSLTSITTRVARFMDTVLVVAESERTDRDEVRRATSLLGHVEGKVGVVLNKHRSYVPKRLMSNLE